MSSAVLDLDRLRQSGFVSQVEWHATIASTNDRALQLAVQESIDTPLLILAEGQTAGRGRGGNRWWSGSGALTFSLIIDPARIRGISLRTEHWPRVALAAGVSLCETLNQVAPHLACGLKWPNDVQIAGRKVAGILVEIPPTQPPAPRRLVLGMGVNVNNSLVDSPAEIQTLGISLADATGLEFDLTGLLLTWLSRLNDNLQALAEDDPQLPGRWQSRCVLQGRTVELLSGDQPIRGLCRGIDTDGALLLDTTDGPRRLYGGVLVRISD